MKCVRFTAALLVLIGCGCAGGGAGQSEPNLQGSSRTIVTPSSSIIGKVISVDLPGRFAVLSFPVGRLPELDRRCDLYRRGLKVGEVRINGPRTGDNTVADIVTGDAEAGDEVRPR